MKVTQRSETAVLPATPSGGGSVMQLSNSDKAMPRFYISLVFFFAQKPAGPDAFHSLKASLAHALSLFPPAAGRLHDKGTTGELEIHCNDAGALLVEAWVDASFSDFSPSFDPHPDFALLVPSIDPAAPVSSVPPLQAQMTHFQCGHATLGIRVHHSIADALSVAHFLSSWSVLTPSPDSDQDMKARKAPFPLQPHLDRSILDADPSAPLISHHPEYQAEFPNLPTSLPPSVTKLFSFTPSFIDALRDKAKVGNSPSHSRFEALAAHLWRGINVVRGLPPDQEIRLGISTDGRRRFNPPLPEGFFGNAIFFGFISTQAKEVMENSPSHAADLVKKAMANVTDAHMRSALNWYEKQASPKTVFVSFWRPQYDVAITSWWRMPLYDLDFGWGKPSYIRFPVPFYDGVIFLLPSPLGPGHVDALIDLEVEHMPKLEAYINDV